MTTLGHLVIAAAGLASFAAPGAAQTAAAPPAPAATAQPDIMSKAINVPGVNWQVYGPNQTAKPVKTQGVPGNGALHVEVTAKGGNPWDVGGLSPIQKPIGAGDVILVAVWLRAPALKDGETTPIPFLGATAAAAPYANIAVADVRITNAWKLYFASGKAANAFAAGAARATVHLAADKHVVELGPIFVLDFGPDYDIRRAPKN